MSEQGRGETQRANGGADRESDEADELMWTLMLMLRQSEPPSGSDYMLGSY